MTMSRLKHGIICALQEEAGSIICFRYWNLDILPVDKIISLVALYKNVKQMCVYLYWKLVDAYTEMSGYLVLQLKMIKHWTN